MPPGARPWIRPDTVTVIVGSCRIRASMRASAWTNARSSPDAIAGIPPARSNAATVTARLAPAASAWRGQGSTGSGSTPCSKLVQQFCQSHSSASSAWRCDGISAASVGSTATRPHTRSAPAASDLEIPLDPIRRGRRYRHPLSEACRRDPQVRRHIPLPAAVHCQRSLQSPRMCGRGHADGYGRQIGQRIGQAQRSCRHSCWPAGTPHRLASSAVRARKDKPSIRSTSSLAGIATTVGRLD